MPTPSFADLGLNEQLLKSLTESGFTAPTAVQEMAIPVLLKSEQDSVVLAQTGAISMPAPEPGSRIRSAASAMKY